LGLSLPVSIVLATLASVVSPSSTMMTIRQTNARGDYVNTLLSVIAIDDIIGMISFSVAVSIAMAFTGGGISLGAIGMPLLYNAIMVAVGVLLGLVLKLFLRKRSNDNRLIVSIALLFLLCGAGSMLGVSPLLGCMIMGAVYVNISGDEKLFKQIRYFSPPILLIYFVRSGLNFDLKALTTTGVTAIPLIVLCLIYIVVQFIGKYAGAYLGSTLMKKPKEFKLNFGLALLPQAGIAIGLSELASRYLSGADGTVVKTIILSVGIICEIFGPVLADLALRRSGSYGASETVIDEELSRRVRHEELVKKLNDIKSEISVIDYARSENEEAFMELEEEYYIPKNNKFRNRR
jgi:Kef-type K+ transport system membrane component KefB